MSVFDAREVMQALIHLNEWEDELKLLGPRTVRRARLQELLTAERPKVAPFILAHHDRLRARGRCSTAPVREWVCRSCFISVPIGQRTSLSHRDDLCVCDNCGTYIYLPTPEQEQEWQAALDRKRQAVQTKPAASSAPTPTPTPTTAIPTTKARKRPGPAAKAPRPAAGKKTARLPAKKKTAPRKRPTPRAKR
ncbi:MAG: hypothetical protein SFU85_01175 [Candidatus Methylacidiphilales bacterium]|nr:hypothetical protein [Candidatus Methylacidiphilales bacterium]